MSSTVEVEEDALLEDRGKMPVFGAIKDNLVGFFMTPSPEGKIAKLWELVGLYRKAYPQDEEIPSRFLEAYESWRSYKLASVCGAPIEIARAEARLIAVFWDILMRLPSGILKKASEEVAKIPHSNLADLVRRGDER
ncbi:MAG: hypothetical protein QXP84_07460 [Candidatus Korarchaeum sp.]